MFHLSSKANGVKALSVVILLITTILASCTYRFTNRHVAAPGGIRSIAIESIYDTSKEVLHTSSYGSPYKEPLLGMATYV